MKKLAIASALLSAFAITGTAHAYQSEVGASVGYVDPDHGSSGSEIGINGTYYLDPVQTRNSPLAEAALLDRASNVSAYANFADRGQVDDNRYGVGVEYFVPGSDFYVSGEVSRDEVKRDHPLYGKEKFNTTYYGAEVGYLPAPGFLVALGLKGYDNDNDDGVDPTLRAKYVTQMNGHDVNLEAGAAFGDLDEYNLAADYYVDKTFSVGADYYSNDVTDTDEFGVNARKFFSQQVSLEGRVGFGKAGGNDYNSFGVAAKYRF